MAIVGVVFRRPLTTIYHYETPFYESTIYRRVLVSLGSKTTVGYAIPPTEEKTTFKLKPIIKVLDEPTLINDKTLQLAKWLSAYTFCSLGEALGLFFPFGIYQIPLAKKKEEVPSKNSISKEAFSLTEEQKVVSRKIIEGSKEAIFLLHGVTGSGKTYVYASLLLQVLSEGKSGIVIVPEISLTPQIQLFFEKVLGCEIAVIHSLMTVSQKYKLWLRITRGEIKIVLGARSALFAPIENLGIIIIDEEHDSSYKNSSVPRYHSKSIAQQLIKLYDAKLVLGSATPSLESYYQAKKGVVKLLTLNSRPTGTALPKTQIVLPSSKKDFLLPFEVTEAIDEVVLNKQQVIIFLNKKGYAGVKECLDCGHIEKCPRCSIALTEFGKNKVLFCHYCGFSRGEFTCSQCGSEEFERRVWGTERLEEELNLRQQGLKLGRMDSDLFRKEKKTQITFKKFKTGELNLLIGTQILAKGHDFPGVMLVIILSPENALNLPDFRSSERAFSLLTQVIGRAGRREEQGKALIVTRQAELPAIQYALTQDYENFYQYEIGTRQKFNYPPFCKIFRAVFRGEGELKVKQISERFSKELVECLTSEVVVLGPVPCLLEKIKDEYRWQLVLKIKKVNEFQKSFSQFLKMWKGSAAVYIEYDMDPVEMF